MKALAIGIWSAVVVLTILLIVRMHRLSESLDTLETTTLELRKSAEDLRRDARALRDRVNAIDAGAAR